MRKGHNYLGFTGNSYTQFCYLWRWIGRDLLREQHWSYTWNLISPVGTNSKE